MRATLPMSRSDDDVEHTAVDDSRRLTRYYILALSAVALLSIAGQFFVQSRLIDQLGDSKLVNMAGRQRMLSQRIVKCALVLQTTATTSVERKARRAELQSSLRQWRRSHDELRGGGADGGHRESDGPGTAVHFAQLERAFTAMSSAAERIVAVDAPPQASDVAQLLAEEPAFLEAMDEIVAQYEREAQAKVARLRTLESILLALTLGTLLLEGLCVFRPAARQIRRSFSALVRLGEELRTARDVAESANRAKSQFLANVSHELRTPLHAILGGVEMAGGPHSPAEESRNAERTREALELIDNSARRQLALVNELLDLSQIESGRLRIDDAAFDLHDLLQRNAAMIRPLAVGRGLRFSLDMAADLPRFVRGDALRIGQVLTNLLGNALKFTEVGEIELRAYVCRTNDDAREIRCVVRDTGIGIAREQHDLIFDSFAQVDAAGNRRRQGAGLGLAISKQLAELMHGRLEVDSRIGEGSAFTFAWPCLQCPAIDGGEAPTAEPAAGAGDKTFQVLIVDDSAAGRRVLEAMLTDLGHLPTCCADGASAVEAFRGKPFDVVLLDVNMPTWDGIAVAAELRRWETTQQRRRATILFVTADATYEQTPDRRSKDVDGCLLKPFSSRDLKRILSGLGASLPADLADPSPDNGVSASESVRDRALLRLGGNQKLLNELVAIFLTEAPRQFERLQSAVDESRNNDAVLISHLLQGQLRMLEQPEATLVLELESSSISGDTDVQTRSLTALTQVWPQILNNVEMLTVV